MSHFTVMVVGDDVKGQLAPFHEFECTGDDNQYVKDIDVTEETLQEYEEHKEEYKSTAEFVKAWHGTECVTFGDSPDTSGEHKFGYALLDKSGEVTKVVRRTNPDRKWDWYQIGGRWNGFFKLKSNGIGIIGNPGLNRMNPDYKPPKRDRADQAHKGDIDVEGMRNEAAEKASSAYDLFDKVTKNLPAIIKWEIILEKNGKENVEKAREEYHDQPAIKALRENDETRWFDEEDFLCSKEEYVDGARKGAFSTFAVLKDGQWYERGKMGWWACVSDEKDETEWRNQFSSLIDSLPDTTLLTVVDCHI